LTNKHLTKELVAYDLIRFFHNLVVA